MGRYLGGGAVPRMGRYGGGAVHYDNVSMSVFVCVCVCAGDVYRYPTAKGR